MPTKRTYRIFLISIISAIFAFMALFFAFKMIKDKNEHSASILAEIESKIDQKNNISQLEKTVLETKEKEALLSSYLVHADLVDSFINFLEREGDYVSVPVEVVAVNSVKENENLLNIEIKGVGSFEHIMRLIVLIQNAPYQIKINYANVNKIIKSDEKNKSAGGFELSLGFNVVSIK